MDQLRLLCETYVHHIQSLPKSPLVIWKAGNQAHQEGFSCRYAKKTVHLEATNLASALFGIHQLRVGLASGHQGEFYGDWKPKFPLRPLWSCVDSEIKLSAHMGVGIPSQFKDSQYLHRFCQRTLELGYNAIVFGIQSTVAPTCVNIELDFIVSFLHQYGLKVIVKPHLKDINLKKCPIDKSYTSFIKNELHQLFKKAPAIDFLFWEAEFQTAESMQHVDAQEMTEAELVRAEILSIEESISHTNVSLIFYIPSQNKTQAFSQANWFPQLSDEVSDETVLAFSATAGSLTDGHLGPHPFWNSLRCSPDISSTRFLPIVNIGAVQQGDGLWPVLTLDTAQEYLSRCYRHQFAGVMGLIPQLPCLGALLDCNLWVSAQFLWKPQSPELLAETWFTAHRPDLNYGSVKNLLKKVREMSLELNYLRSLNNEKPRDSVANDELRALAETLLIRLKHMQMVVEKMANTHGEKSINPTWNDYFAFFARDAKRIIMHTLQGLRISSLTVRVEDDQQPGFWTELKNGSIQLLQEPFQGIPGSRMAQIYAESRLSQ